MPNSDWGMTSTPSSATRTLTDVVGGTALLWGSITGTSSQAAPPGGWTGNHGPVNVTTLTATAGLILPKTSGIGIKIDTAAPTFPWRDLIGDMRPDPGGTNSPTLNVFRGGAGRQYSYSVNDKMDFQFHIPHDYVPGTDLFIHIHWSHNGTAISGNMVASIASTYAKGHNQAIFPAEKTVTITYPTVDIATTPQYIHRIDEVQWSSSGGSSTLFDTAIIEPDGLILGCMTVTGIPTITGGSPNEPFVTYVDLHYQSTGMGTKQKAPSFYV
jgi:hypothetical protein